jgi:hypothetical protein
MSDAEIEESGEEPLIPPAYNRNDPIMTIFVVGVMVLLAGIAILILIAAGRPPAGL